MTALPSRCGIDVHAHVVPESFPSYIGDRVPAAWPGTEVAPDVGGQCHRHVMVAGKNYRTVSEKCWSVEHRLADLPAMGLAHQVISPMPELLSYWLEPADAQQLLRFLNEQAAAMVAESNGRLIGLGAIPLQAIDLEIRELRYVVQTLKMVGVEVAATSTVRRSEIHDSGRSSPRARIWAQLCSCMQCGPWGWSA